MKTEIKEENETKNKNKETYKKNLNLLILLLIIILLGIIASFVIDTLAKYLTEVSGRADTSIAEWKISVNNIDVTTGADISHTIEPVLPGNEHIKAGVIAPNAEGYFDLNLDYTNVDVSFEYFVDIESADTSAVSDLIITGYSADSGPMIPIDSGNFSKEVDLDEVKRTEILRIHFKWNDDSTATMDNIADTNTTINPTSLASLIVNLRFIQKAI